MFLFFALYHSMLSGSFNDTEIWRGIFVVLNFGSGIFFGFWFLPPFDHPCHLKPGLPPPPPQDKLFATKAVNYLQSQNSSWLGSSFTCLCEYTLPRMFPSQTSNPLSAKMYPRLFVGPLRTQLVLSIVRPCWRNTTGLEEVSLLVFRPYGILWRLRMKPSWVVT